MVSQVISLWSEGRRLSMPSTIRGEVGRQEGAMQRSKAGVKPTKSYTLCFQVGCSGRRNMSCASASRQASARACSSMGSR